MDASRIRSTGTRPANASIRSRVHSCVYPISRSSIAISSFPGVWSKSIMRGRVFCSSRKNGLSLCTSIISPIPFPFRSTVVSTHQPSSSGCSDVSETGTAIANVGRTMMLKQRKVIAFRVADISSPSKPKPLRHLNPLKDSVLYCVRK